MSESAKMAPRQLQHRQRISLRLGDQWHPASPARRRAVSEAGVGRAEVREVGQQVVVRLEAGRGDLAVGQPGEAQAGGSAGEEIEQRGVNLVGVGPGDGVRAAVQVFATGRGSRGRARRRATGSSPARRAPARAASRSAGTGRARPAGRRGTSPEPLVRTDHTSHPSHASRHPVPTSPRSRPAQVLRIRENPWPEPGGAGQGTGQGRSRMRPGCPEGHRRIQGYRGRPGQCAAFRTR